MAAADELRFARVVLAALNGAPDAVVLIGREVKDCVECLQRFAGAGVGMCIGQMLSIGTLMAGAEEHQNPSSIPPTDEQKWDAINRYAIAAMEQIVLDAADLETGLSPAAQ